MAGRAGRLGGSRSTLWQLGVRVVAARGRSSPSQLWPVRGWHAALAGRPRVRELACDAGISWVGRRGPLILNDDFSCRATPFAALARVYVHGESVIDAASATTYRSD